MNAARVTVAACVAVLIFVGCGGSDAKFEGDLPKGGEWLAVLQLEEDPNSLDNDADGLREEVSVDAVVVAQVQCFQGLQDAVEIDEEVDGAESDTTPGTYVLGVRASSKDEMKRLLKKVDAEPSVIIGVVDTC